MCKRHAYSPQARLASEGAYEGRTVRLDPRQDTGEGRQASSRGHFPWWMLWLIWPLMMLAKLVLPLALATIGAIGGALAGPGMTLVAVLMIAIGLLLLLRSTK
jgi:Mn2+/Fe2+ NRAMP family transporter